MACVPAIAAADGGGPIFIFAGPVVFLVAQVWIISVEVLVLHRLVPSLSWGNAFKDVFDANLRSYWQVGLLVPIAVSVGGLLLAWAVGGFLQLVGLPALGSSLGSTIVGFAGWVLNDRVAVAALPYGLVTWFVITFFLSVRVEAKVLQRKWHDRGFTSTVTPIRASWIVNAASYAGLSVGIVWMVVSLWRASHS